MGVRTQIQTRQKNGARMTDLPLVNRLYSMNGKGRSRLIGVYGRMSSATRVVDRLMQRELRKNKLCIVEQPSHHFHWEDGKLWMHFWYTIRHKHGKRREIHRKFEIRTETL